MLLLRFVFSGRACLLAALWPKADIVIEWQSVPGGRRPPDVAAFRTGSTLMQSKEQSTFYVRAFWDDEAKVFVSESDIKGLHIEAETLDEFEAVLFEHARELVFENHIKPQLGRHAFDDLFSGKLFPGIVWQRPANADACA
jgi:hypothetical protein